MARLIRISSMVWREKRLSKFFIFVLDYPMGQAVFTALKVLFDSVCLFASKNISDVTCEGKTRMPTLLKKCCTNTCVVIMPVGFCIQVPG